LLPASQPVNISSIPVIRHIVNNQQLPVSLPGTSTTINNQQSANRHQAGVIGRQQLTTITTPG